VCPNPPFKKTYPPLPVIADNLAEWTQFVNARAPAVSQTSIELAGVQRYIEDLGHSATQLPQAEIVKITEKAAKHFNEATETMSEAISHICHEEDPNTKPDGTRIDPFTLAMAALYTFPITPTDYVFLTGSSQVKVEIAKALAEQEILGWKLLAAHCRNQCEIWDKQLADLQAKHDILQEIHNQGRRMQGTMTKKASTIDETEKRISAAGGKNPAFAKLLENQMRARRMGESKSENRFKK